MAWFSYRTAQLQLVLWGEGQCFYRVISCSSLSHFSGKWILQGLKIFPAGRDGTWAFTSLELGPAWGRWSPCSSTVLIGPQSPVGIWGGREGGLGEVCSLLFMLGSGECFWAGRISTSEKFKHHCVATCGFSDLKNRLFFPQLGPAHKFLPCPLLSSEGDLSKGGLCAELRWSHSIIF